MAGLPGWVGAVWNVVQLCARPGIAKSLNERVQRDDRLSEPPVREAAAQPPPQQVRLPQLL